MPVPVPTYMVSVPKNAALAALLRGTGAVTGIFENAINGMSAAADPTSGAAEAVDCGGVQMKGALQLLYNANTGNAAAPLLLAIINSITV